MEPFHVQRNALRTCAKEFDESGEAFASAAGEVGRLGIAKEVFTGTGDEMAKAYESYREQMYNVLNSCDSVLKSAGKALRAVADNSKTVDDDVSYAMSKNLPVN